MQIYSPRLADRMMRAARLDVTLYEEVEHDRSATEQAFAAVIIAAAASGIGSALGGAMGGHGIFAIIGGLIFGVIAAVLGWVVWSYVTFWVGTNLFGGTATPGEMMRTLGFAQSPQVLMIFSFIPVLGGLVSLAVFIWVLVSGVIAIRQALDFDTGKVVATAVIGWLGMLAVSLVLGGIAYMLGMGAMM